MEKDYPYVIEGGKIVVGMKREVLGFPSVRSIPSDVIFESRYVDLNGIEEIPSGVEFRCDFVYLMCLRRISPSARFHKSILVSPLCGGNLHRVSLSLRFGVPGISDYRILNRMVQLSLFDRRR